MESYSVKAILSAEDKGFSSAFRSASSHASTLKSTLTSGIGFGIMMGIGQKALNVVTTGISGMRQEMAQSSATWKTFTGNMQMNGKTAGEIKAVKKELQSFAQQTVYSASDMASTYAQLDAVGTKNTAKLVKGFGGLAAAAENPKQAMKTLSQQATQMAAKPTVAWMDFKLMLDQTPAGIAAVAKKMGKSSQQLIRDVQDGKVATEDFFNAIQEVGTNADFSKLATEYKTVEQAADGLKETLSNTLAPAYEALSQRGIAAISSLADSFGKINGEAVAKKITGFIDRLTPYWNAFKSAASEVASAFGSAVSSIAEHVGKLSGAFGSAESVKNFSSVIGVAKDALVQFAVFLEEHSETIAKLITKLPQLALAFMAFKVLMAVAPFLKIFGSGIASLASQGLSALAAKLFGVASAQGAVGKSSRTSGKALLTSAKAFALAGAGVLMIAVGFGILAYSAIQVANAGPAAIAVMFGLVAALAAVGAGAMLLVKSLSKISAGKLQSVSVAMLALGAAVLMVSAGFYILASAAVMIADAGPAAAIAMVALVAAIAGLAVGAAALGTALTAGAVGFVAFGAAILMVGAGALLASVALAIVAAVLPVIVDYGASGALAIAALGAAMAVFAGGALLAGVGCVVLGVGLAIVAVGLFLVGVAAIVAAVGVFLLSAATLVLGVGLAISAAAVVVMAGALPTMAAGAMMAVAAFAALMALTLVLGVSMLVLAVGLGVAGAAAVVGAVGIAGFGVAIAAAAVGAAAMALALKAVNSSMKSIASNAKSADSSIRSMVGGIDVVNAGLDALGSKAKNSVNKVIDAFTGGVGNATSAGTALGNGFKNGVQTGVNAAPGIARVAVASVSSALRSGESSAYSSGVWIGQGFANGMASTLGMVRSVAAQLAAAADAAVQAKAKIGSPSRVFHILGTWIGKGFANGMAAMKRLVYGTAEDLVAVPAIDDFSDFASGRSRVNVNGTLHDEYSYSRSGTYTIVVPVEMEGREVARVTAPYTEEELENRQQIKNRISGIR